MSILDFTTGLFRDQANLRSFLDDPDRALKEAGLPDATPDEVHALLPVIAESMPPDHPLQRAVQSDDPQAALRNLKMGDDVFPAGADPNVEMREPYIQDPGMQKELGKLIEEPATTPDAASDYVLDKPSFGEKVLAAILPGDDDEPDFDDEQPKELGEPDIDPGAYDVVSTDLPGRFDIT